MRHVYILYHIGAKVVEKNERKSAGSNELADYLTTKRIEFSYSTGKLGSGKVGTVIAMLIVPGQRMACSC